MTKLDRRAFLQGSAAAMLGSTALPGLVARAALAQSGEMEGRHWARPGDGSYGELQPAGDELALPEGFTYVLFGVEGTPMSDGNPTPKGHDGMAALPLANGNIRLIRNHEDRDTPENSTLKGDPAKAYDSIGGGGTTSLEVRVNADGSRELVRDFISLTGTIVNCAGGPTPWNSWLTCEETTEGEIQGWNQDHGYVFEVPAKAEDEVTPVPLKAMGRFVHEAAAIDPRTGIVYLTEDRATAGFYRFLPNNRVDLTQGGRLQMLAIKGRPNYDTATGQRVGKPLPVTWVDINDPDPPEAETNELAVFEQGWAKGGAQFSRTEGCWFGNGNIYLQPTSGGDAGLGQVWQYTPRGKSGGQLTLLFESTSPEVLDAPDNVTVSPRGGIVICEDGDDGNFLRGLTPRGEIFNFAHNIVNVREFAGACFSPDGETLFVNIQGDLSVGGPGNLGMTFAIWGPWENGAL